MTTYLLMQILLLSKLLQPQNKQWIGVMDYGHYMAMPDAEAYCENYFAELQDKLGKGDLVYIYPTTTTGAEIYFQLIRQTVLEPVSH